MIERRLYTPTAAAQAISVSRSTLYRMIAEQRVRTVVVNQRLRVSSDEIARIAAEGAPSLGSSASPSRS
jgi:excisionase family DNA binding protein